MGWWSVYSVNGAAFLPPPHLPHAETVRSSQVPDTEMGLHVRHFWELDGHDA